MPTYISDVGQPAHKERSQTPTASKVLIIFTCVVLWGFLIGGAVWLAVVYNKDDAPGWPQRATSAQSSFWSSFQSVYDTSIAPDDILGLGDNTTSSWSSLKTLVLEQQKYATVISTDGPWLNRASSAAPKVGDVVLLTEDANAYGAPYAVILYTGVEVFSTGVSDVKATAYFASKSGEGGCAARAEQTMGVYNYSALSCFLSYWQSVTPTYLRDTTGESVCQTTCSLTAIEFQLLYSGTSAPTEVFGIGGIKVPYDLNAAKTALSTPPL